MRLTSTLRRSIVNNIIADIPRTDFDEQLRPLVQQEAYRQLPEAVKKIQSDPKLNDYLRRVFVRPVRSLSSVEVCNPYFDVKKIEKKIKTIEKAYEKQRCSVSDIKHVLQGALAKVNTIEKAREVLPEFASYMPEEERPIVYPVAKNVAKELKALGWPANKTKEK